MDLRKHILLNNLHNGMDANGLKTQFVTITIAKQILSKMYFNQGVLSKRAIFLISLLKCIFRILYFS